MEYEAGSALRALGHNEMVTSFYYFGLDLAANCLDWYRGLCRAPWCNLAQFQPILIDLKEKHFNQ